LPKWFSGLSKKTRSYVTSTSSFLHQILILAQLLKGIFQFCEIKNSAPLLAYLAKQIGDGTSRISPTSASLSLTFYSIDCTPKAVSHRLTNLRNTGKPLNGSPAKSAASTPKTPKSRAKKQKPATSESDEPEGLQDEPEAASPLAGKKRRRATPKKNVDYKETDGEDDSDEKEYIPFQGWKKVKKEPVEEERVVFGEDVQASVEEV
jgi:hypothetical protein